MVDGETYAAVAAKISARLALVNAANAAAKTAVNPNMKRIRAFGDFTARRMMIANGGSMADVVVVITLLTVLIPLFE